MGCADGRAHNFDAVQAGDFYRLAAFFADVQQWGVYMDYAYTPNPDLRGFSNDHPFPPLIEVESPYLIDRMAKINGRIREALLEGARRISSDPSRLEEFEEWVNSALKPLDRPEPAWITP